MAKVKVAQYGTVGKCIQFDPEAGPRAEAAVEALAQAISEGIGGTIQHSSLLGLQVGDDHPQYAMWQAAEIIQGEWNFETIPLIQGDTLAEYIEDVVGGSFFDFLQDTSSVVWTYHETANQLEANVPPEFVQDTVGAMLTDSTSIDFTYNDGAGTFTAAVIDEYVQDLVGAMLVDSTSIDFTYNDGAGTFTASTINADPSGLIGMSAVNGTAATPLRSDGRHAIDPAIAPTWTGVHTHSDRIDINMSVPQFRLIDPGAAADARVWRFAANSSGLAAFQAVSDDGATARNVWIAQRQAGSPDLSTLQMPYDNYELQIGAGQDLRLYHNGTNSVIENDTGDLILRVSGELQVDEVTSSTSATGGSATALPALPQGYMTLVINGTSRKIPYYAT